jgi:hypothetical protein
MANFLKNHPVSKNNPATHGKYLVFARKNRMLRFILSMQLDEYTEIFNC